MDVNLEAAALICYLHREWNNKAAGFVGNGSIPSSNKTGLRHS